MQNSSTISIFRKPVIKLGLYIYLSLTIFERFLNREPFGSLIKIYGLTLLFFWFLDALRQRKPLKFGRIVIGFMLWLSVVVLSLLWTPAFSLGRYYVLAIGNMVMIILMVYNIDWNPDDVEWFMLLYKVSTLVFAILMIRNANFYHGKGIRYTLAFGDSEIDPNNIAGLLIPGLIIALHSLLGQKNGKLLRTLFDLFTIALVLIAIFMGGSRGGILGLFVGISVYFTFWVLKTNSGSLLAKSIMAVFLLTLMAFLITSQVDEELLQRIMPSTYLADRGANRLDTWIRAIQVWSQKPILGCGIGGFAGITGKGVHNTYLLVLTEQGLIGFICWFSALLSVVVNAWKKRDYLILSLVLSMMVIIFFLDAYQKKFMWNVLLIAAVKSKATQFEFFNSDDEMFVKEVKNGGQ